MYSMGAKCECLLPRVCVGGCVCVSMHVCCCGCICAHELWYAFMLNCSAIDGFVVMLCSTFVLIPG